MTTRKRQPRDPVRKALRDLVVAQRAIVHEMRVANKLLASIALAYQLGVPVHPVSNPAEDADALIAAAGAPP